MNPGRLSAAGYGEFKPVANNSSVEGKQKNRRVDIVIMSEHEATKEPGHIGFSHSELSNATPPMIRVNPTFGTRSKP
jgi:hypothetical protein